jgi:thiol-disulfide isomerase/thioredoxin
MRHPPAIARRAFLTWLWATVPAAAFAADASNTPLAELAGQTTDRQNITLQQLRGQVVLVFYWSTECPVCLAKMPELRANAAGWHGKNFTLLGVNMDKKRKNSCSMKRWWRRCCLRPSGSSPCGVPRPVTRTRWARFNTCPARC